MAWHFPPDNWKIKYFSLLPLPSSHTQSRLMFTCPHPLITFVWHHHQLHWSYNPLPPPFHSMPSSSSQKRIRPLSLPVRCICPFSNLEIYNPTYPSPLFFFLSWICVWLLFIHLPLSSQSSQLPILWTFCFTFQFSLRQQYEVILFLVSLVSVLCVNLNCKVFNFLSTLIAGWCLIQWALLIIFWSLSC